MTKYNSIMSLTNVRDKLERMNAEEREKFLNLNMHVTEKIHGENFRVGVDEQGAHFIGQRNVKYIWNGTDFLSERDGKSQHPRRKHLSEMVWRDIHKILEWIEIQKAPYTFFGEVFGNNVQKGFTYVFDDNEIVWFDVHNEDGYLPPEDAEKILDGLKLLTPPFIGFMTMKELIDNFDVTALRSKLAIEGYVEGVVAKPANSQMPEWWDFTDRLIIKKKIPKFAEQKQKGPKKKKKNVYESPFDQFVVEQRLIHVLSELKEKGHEISIDKNFRFLVVESMLFDIMKEENNGEQFTPLDRKALSKAIHQLFSQFIAG